MNSKTLRIYPRVIPFDCAIDRLEPRTLFSAPYEFAAVGIRFDASAGHSVFEMLGTLAADGGVTGTQTVAQRTGSSVAGPIDFASFQLLSNGRFLTTPRTGVDPYATQLGDNFIGERGYPFGSLFAEFANDGPTDIAFLLHRVAGNEVEWEGLDAHEFQYLELSADGFSIHAGRFDFYDNAPGTLDWSDSVDGADPQSIAITSQDEFGSLTLADGRVLHTNIAPYPLVGMNEGPFPPGQITLIVDTDNSDGKVGIGIARKINAFFPFAPADMFGVYRTSLVTSGPMSEAFFGAAALPGGLASARVALEIGSDGRYAVYPLEGYDAGQRVAISTGDWVTVDESAQRSGVLNLRRDTDQAIAVFTVTQDHALVPWLVRDGDGVDSEQMIGSAVAFTPAAAFDRGIIGGHVALDDNGHPIFYLSSIDDPYAHPPTSHWYSEDLVELWGGKPLVAVDSIGYGVTQQVLGVATDGDVLLWARAATGRWSFRNITQELGASPVVSDISIFEHSGTDFSFSAGNYRTRAVAGKSADGDLLLYSATYQATPFPRYEWTAVNVTESGLDPNGQPTPQWTGGIQGYQTSWNGLNIVGIDASGDLVVAWTAPELPGGGWLTTNLSDLAGTPTLVGAISILMTEWNGIHIHALDADGNLHSTWWVPQLGGDWEHNNLTDELAGPPLDSTRNTDRTESFSTFIGVGNTLNIVGYDANGRVRVYWWSPESNIWLVGDITDSFPPSEAPVGFSSSDRIGSTDANEPYWLGGQSLYGYNADGSFSRVWWAANGSDIWHVENLTELAIPIVS